jgi:hypothetical protein
MHILLAKIKNYNKKSYILKTIIFTILTEDTKHNSLSSRSCITCYGNEILKLYTVNTNSGASESLGTLH